ncbi:peptidase U32 family protein [Paenibacillus tarimensis]|uniref:peptidase U32 family protein n=1 Tax=Paenibacillus tarimensis TaxID=416012 RepID=UPI001F44280E|nr:peptidase U32 family protein [Paenibacillus tarimensis]MCF2944030.1 U32 family peptidase [Paenibacillus tarimensis]
MDNGYRPELLVMPSSLEEMRLLGAAGANAFTVGEARYGMRLAGEFDLKAVQHAAEYTRANNFKLYAAVNNLIDNETLPDLPAYIRGLAEAGVDAVIFGDPAVLMTVRSEAPQLELHWNAEMTSTNYATANYWGRRGAHRVVLARELNMEQVIEVKQHTELQVEVQVHGMTNIYHSKRSLLHSYLDHQAKSGIESELKEEPGSFGQTGGLFLVETERPEERYPIYEDSNGTHIMSSDDICMLENLHELLEAGIDSFKIEGILKTPAYNETVVRAYRYVIDKYLKDPAGYQFQDEWLEPIREIQDPKRELSFGFFYKEQVY